MVGSCTYWICNPYPTVTEKNYYVVMLWLKGTRINLLHTENVWKLWILLCYILNKHKLYDIVLNELPNHDLFVTSKFKIAYYLSMRKKTHAFFCTAYFIARLNLSFLKSESLFSLQKLNGHWYSRWFTESMPQILNKFGLISWWDS